MRVRRGAAAFTGRTDERTGGLESALSSCAVLARLDRRLLYAMRTRFHRKWTERVAKVLALVGEFGAIWLAIGLRRIRKLEA